MRMDSTTFTVEAQYIKKLEQQIYFLELEASFLREQTKKATELSPQLTTEAEHLLQKLLDIRSEAAGLQLEVKRKDANLLMLQRDLVRMKGQIREAEASHTKGKKQLLEDIVQAKKTKQLTDRQISQKEMEILYSKQELEQKILNVANADHQVEVLQAQLKQRLKNQKEMENQLSQKRIELLKVNSARHEMEDKLIKQTATTKNQLTRDLRNEISFLHQQLREKDLQSEQDHVLRKKMMDDCASLTSENSVLQTQLLEITKQLEMINLLQSGNTLQGLNTNTLSSQIAELQAMLAKEEQINIELWRDKTLLVDHVSQLQNQIASKKTELLHISARRKTLDKRLSTVRSEQSLQRSLQSVRWREILDLAGSMEKL